MFWPPGSEAAAAAGAVLRLTGSRSDCRLNREIRAAGAHPGGGLRWRLCLERFARRVRDCRGDGEAGPQPGEGLLAAQREIRFRRDEACHPEGVNNLRDPRRADGQQSSEDGIGEATVEKEGVDDVWRVVYSASDW